jgi:uncharacterized protein (TIGR02646 family)
VHKLDRAKASIPTCLATPTVANYGRLRGADKESIRQALFTIQGERCAYCERRTGTGEKDGHIEHFRNQANHAQLDLHWPNLFWSCNDTNSCGKHKDDCDIKNGTSTKAEFNPDHIIDPGSDNPDDFLIFVYDGEVKPKVGLAASELRKATETLRVFQLADSPFLRKSRSDAVSPYVSQLDLLLQIAPDRILAYAQSELGKTQHAPFYTAIRHFLTQFAC